MEAGEELKLRLVSVGGTSYSGGGERPSGGKRSVPLVLSISIRSSTVACGAAEREHRQRRSFLPPFDTRVALGCVLLVVLATFNDRSKTGFPAVLARASNSTLSIASGVAACPTFFVDEVYSSSVQCLVVA